MPKTIKFLIIWLWWNYQWFVAAMNISAFVLPMVMLAQVPCDVMDMYVYLWFISMNALASLFCVITNPEQKERHAPPFRGGIVDMDVML